MKGDDDESRAEVSGKMSIPIVPLHVPHAETFSILAAFLYTRRAAVLIRSLLEPALTSNPNTKSSSPLSSSAESDTDSEPTRGRTRTRTPSPTSSTSSRHSSNDAKSANLSLHLTPKSMRACMLATHGLYLNMLALGCDDELLWGAVRYVWGVVCEGVKGVGA